MMNTTISLLFVAALPGTIALYIVLNKLCNAYEHVNARNPVPRVWYVGIVFDWLVGFRARVRNTKIVSLKYVEWKGDVGIFHRRNIYFGGYRDECVRFTIDGGGADESGSGDEGPQGGTGVASPAF